MVVTSSNSCHKCGSAGTNILTYRFHDVKSEYFFCEKCWASELVITDKSQINNQTEHPTCQAEEKSDQPCATCLLANGIETTYPTSKKFVVITKENKEEVQPGAHLAYTLNILGEQAILI